jgi:hypothetical protein
MSSSSSGRQKPERQKQGLAERVRQAVMTSLGYGGESVKRPGYKPLR